MTKAEIAIIVIVTILIIFVFAMFESRCPNCKKFWALEEVSRTLVSSEPTTIYEEWTESDGTKHCDGYPGVEKTYKCEEKCKYCGNVCYSTTTSKEKI